MNVFAGATLALAARRSIQASPEAVAQAPLMRAAAYLLFVFLPMGGFLVWAYPAWSWMYLLNPEEVGAAVSVAAVLGYPLCGLVGYFATERMLRRGRGRPWAPAALGLVGSCLVTVGLWSRLVPVGRYAEWELEIARPMWRHGPWMWDMILAGGVIVGAYLVLLRANYRGVDPT